MVPEPDKGTRFTPEGWTGLSPSHLLVLYLWQADFRERTETERSVMNSDSDDDGGGDSSSDYNYHSTSTWTHRDTDLKSNSVSVRLSSLRQALVFSLL